MLGPKDFVALWGMDDPLVRYRKNIVKQKGRLKPPAGGW
jgi:hypothetical protein